MEDYCIYMFLYICENNKNPRNHWEMVEDDKKTKHFEIIRNLINHGAYGKADSGLGCGTINKQP